MARIARACLRPRAEARGAQWRPHTTATSKTVAHQWRPANYIQNEARIQAARVRLEGGGHGDPERQHEVPRLQLAAREVRRQLDAAGGLQSQAAVTPQTPQRPCSLRRAALTLLVLHHFLIV